MLVAVCMLCHKAAPSSDLEKSQAVRQNGMILSLTGNISFCFIFYFLFSFTEYGDNKIDDTKSNVKSKVEALEYEIALNSIETNCSSIATESKRNTFTCTHDKKSAVSVHYLHNVHMLYNLLARLDMHLRLHKELLHLNTMYVCLAYTYTWLHTCTTTENCVLAFVKNVYMFDNYITQLMLILIPRCQHSHWMNVWDANCQTTA